MQGIASGELEGVGEWIFEEKDGITSIQYYWNVKTTLKWMNKVAFIMKPLFKFSHNLVMKWGAKGLAKKLDAPLIAY